MRIGVLLTACAVAFLSAAACAQNSAKPPSQAAAKTAAKAAPTAAAKAATTDMRVENETRRNSASKRSSETVDQAPATTDDAARASSQSRSAATTAKDKTEPTADQEKRIKSLMRQVQKSFAAAELSDEQQSQADKILAKASRDFVVKRDLAMITVDLQKKHATELKAAKREAKSVKEQDSLAFAKASFTDEQAKVFKSTQASMDRAKRQICRLLDEQQIARLPDALQALINAGQ